MEVEEMATQMGRETEKATTHRDMVLVGLDIGMALLMDIDMAVDFRDPKERDPLMEKLLLEDLDSTEVVQEDMCEKEGSIQEEQAPAAGSD